MFVLHVESPFHCYCPAAKPQTTNTLRGIDHRTCTRSLVDYCCVTRRADASGALTGVFAAPPNTAQVVLRNLGADRHQLCGFSSLCGPLRRRAASTGKSPAIYRPSHQIIHMGVTGTPSTDASDPSVGPMRPSFQAGGQATPLRPHVYFHLPLWS